MQKLKEQSNKNSAPKEITEKARRRNEERKIKEFKKFEENIQRQRNRSERERRKNNFGSINIEVN